MEIENLKLQKQIDELIDKIYPIGSYYETSDDSFNPNTAWGGTWVEETDGSVLIAQGKNYNGSLATVGKTVGQDDFQLSIGQIPGHSHTYQKSNATSGSHTLTIQEIPSHAHIMRVRPASYPGDYWGDPSMTDANAGGARDGGNTTYTGGSKGHTHPINFTSTNTGTAGASASNQSRVSVVQKSKVVCRWHRTA